MEKRDSLKLLKGLGEKFSPPYGFYASSRYEGITVGISKYPFKTSTSVFITVKGGEDSLKKIRKEALRLGILQSIDIKGTNIYDEEGKAKEHYFLLKAEKEGIDLSPSFISPYAELKSSLKGLLFKFEGERKDYAVSNPEKTGNKTVDKLIEYASQVPLKVLIHLDSDYRYSVEVNSLFAEGEPPYSVFIGMRKRLSREFYLPEEIELTIPSNALVDNSNGLYVIVPLGDGTTFNEALESLKKNAYFKKRDLESEENFEPKF